MTRIPAILFSILIICCCRSSAQFPVVQQKAFLVKRMIELNHYSPRAVDDSFSSGLFKAVINTADSRRLFFTATEYKQLSGYMFKLDDELQGRDWEFLNLFTSLYKRSLLRADSILNAALKKPFDFTLNESLGTSGRETYNFAATDNDLYNRWSRYLKFIALGNIYDATAHDSSNKIFSKETIVKLEPGIRDKIRLAQKKSIKRILEHPQGFDNFLSDLYLNSMASRFDPHTNYFSPEDKEVFQSSLSTEGYSYGLSFDENENGKIVIVYLVPGGPAWKSGELNKGDELIQLYRENKEPAEISGMTLEEVDDILENPTQEKLIVKIKKTNGAVKSIILRKEKITHQENIVKSFVLTGEKKIGYILLPGFYTEWENESGSGCANDVAKEIIKLKRENIDGLIIDVRFNGGGSINEGLEMTGIFVDEGPLAGQKDAKGKIFYYKDPNRGVIYAGPLALMVNGQSASASEMLAASLQDYNRAVIIGSTTYGKASVQQLFPLDTTYRESRKQPGNDADMVKITFGKFYRLNGLSAQLKGVTPDVILPDAFDGLDIGEKFSTNVLPSDTIQKNNYYKPLSPLPVNELAKLSRERISYDNDFNNIQKLAEAQLKAGKIRPETIPLKWDAFEKWVQQHELEMKIMEGVETKTGSGLTVENNQQDKQLLQNNDYEKEINRKWLDNIAEDIYIREAFFVVRDLINLQKTSSKN